VKSEQQFRRESSKDFASTPRARRGAALDHLATWCAPTTPFHDVHLTRVPAETSTPDRASGEDLPAARSPGLRPSWVAGWNHSIRRPPVSPKNAEAAPRAIGTATSRPPPSARMFSGGRPRVSTTSVSLVSNLARATSNRSGGSWPRAPEAPRPAKASSLNSRCLTTSAHGNALHTAMAFGSLVHKEFWEEEGLSGGRPPREARPT